MSNDKIDPRPDPARGPQESRDYLTKPKKGKGVRRLNRVPLLTVGGIVMLVVLGISYTFFARQAQNTAKFSTTGPQPPISTTAAPPVRPSGPDYISEPPQTPVETPTTPNDTQPQGRASVSPAAQSDAYKNWMRLIQRVEEKKLADLEVALVADGAVPNFKRNSQGERRQQDDQQKGPQQNSTTQASETDQKMRQYLAAIGGDGGSMAAENQQDEKRAFLSSGTLDHTTLNARRRAALAPMQEVKAGTIIPGVMISGLNSDLPGQIIAQVRESVYDSATGTQVLIPAGARLVGTYDSSVTLGQDRVLVGWERIIYPDGSSISLAKMPGTDVSGYAGFNDKVNNHYWRIFGNGLLLSLFSAGIQLSQPPASNSQNNSGSQSTPQQTTAGSMGQQMGEIGKQMTKRNMNIQPTLEIRPGYRFNVMVTKDIILPTWKSQPTPLQAEQARVPRVMLEDLQQPDN
ncbi:conjugal transfer protein TrbI [Verminephrobacter aporrectodeae subsp. tuberculatae]|uniref:Conjugal transfer protein TrbI n=1 Tax=Verminephrobacter aporrectodeae subsp. tuberculatae TaxID=1110392 RepID=A0ABT3KQU5_9BURK|nr:TrbI/VirB10 family protein [Verminephrobacter aporrectodeae]MCW5320685.1 conjugal transfer protein TrbI [Verminephrobacter aporrectodeae subsp. tuberculatae]